MATVSTPKMTAEEFNRWLFRSENTNHRFELIDGCVTQCPLPSLNPARFPVVAVLQEYGDCYGKWTMRMFDDGLIIKRNPDTVLTPDLMFYLNPKPADDFPYRVTDEVPALVVDVLPSTNISCSKVTRRLTAYLRDAGVPMYWVLDPVDQSVCVHWLPYQFHVLDRDDELTGNGVLPDFRCRVADLFALPGQPPAAPNP